MVIGIEQQIYHEANDFARREVVARRLVRSLVESPDEVFEYQSHFVIGNGIGVKVDLGKLADNQVEDVGFF